MHRRDFLRGAIGISALVIATPTPTMPESIPFVPKSMKAIIHSGESILPANGFEALGEAARRLGKAMDKAAKAGAELGPNCRCVLDIIVEGRQIDRALLASTKPYSRSGFQRKRSTSHYGDLRRGRSRRGKY